MGVGKKVLVENLDEHLIVAKFSDSQIIKNKTKQKEIPFVQGLQVRWNALPLLLLFLIFIL